MDARGTLRVGSQSYEIFRLDALQEQWDVARLPYTLRVLLENLLRAGEDVEPVAGWVATEEPSREIAFRPSRVLHQDFTGVPAIVDLAAMRNAMQAEAAMLGEALSMLVPQVVGFRLTGELPEGATATDLVLTVTEMLRKTGVVGKFVEYFGPGLASLNLADRATIGNMSPEYGA